MSANLETSPLDGFALIAVRGPDESFDSWFARADEALYRATQAGRDRVV